MISERHRTGLRTLVADVTERPLTWEPNAPNATERPTERPRTPSPLGLGAPNGRPNERPLTTDGRDLCDEVFERIRADHQAALLPSEVEEIRAVEAARPATDAELSKTAKALLKTARSAGWDVRATYAQAYAPVAVMVEDVGAPLTPTGRVARKKVTQTQLVDSVVVRLRSPEGVRAVVIYEAGKPLDAWIWVEGVDGVSASNVTTVTGLVAGTWPTPIEEAEISALNLESVA